MWNQKLKKWIRGTGNGFPAQLRRSLSKQESLLTTEIPSAHSRKTYSSTEQEEPNKQEQPLTAPTRNSQANVIFIVPELHQHYSRNLTKRSLVPAPTATNQKRNHQSSDQSFHSSPCSGTYPNKPGFVAVENETFHRKGVAC